MREIKFRGRLLDNGEWVYGGLVIDEKLMRALIFNKPHAAYCFTNDVSVEVDPATVGQYTGLLDKGEREIYEGDAVRIIAPGIEAVGVVTWEPETAAFRFVYVDADEETQWDEMMWLTECYEIIGNIHDNPELREVSHAG